MYIGKDQNKDFLVFQVKFVRNPNKIEDVHKWFTEIVEKEAPKIDRLIPKGAIGFYLLTNVKGTAHLESGSIDKVNTILESVMNVPSFCWWRDDLCRLFEKSHSLMWTFPEILNGKDILNLVLLNHLSENKEKRERTIRSYLADQYAIDNEVKFKQIDLQNKLLDLFTDVPISIKKWNRKNKALRKTLNVLGNNTPFLDIENNYYRDDNESVGAASFLLNSKVQEEIQRVLLEEGQVRENQQFRNIYVKYIEQGCLTNHMTLVDYP